ncbi:MAG: hypothetical protein WCC17_16250 [Candidatus Nitrosopolaris sp.]
MQYYITMHTKTSIVFGIIAIASAVLFAVGPATHQAWACGFGGCGCGGSCSTFGGWGTYTYGGFGVSSGGSGGW